MLGVLLAAPGAAGQVADEPVEAVPVAAAEAAAADPARARLEWGIEVKTHVRDSEANRFPVPFPFTPDMLPPGAAQGSMATVDPGSHLEISTATLFLDAAWGPSLAARLKVDVVDLYDRNPTSTDREI
ncbi:MAG TPA: hypothetical protein VF100_02235, partial [Thermoanaerobaculia bacterium]